MVLDGMKKLFIASNSNGKDSLFMILELIRKNYPLDLVLFFDGGKEFKAIYEVWEGLKIILDKFKKRRAKIRIFLVRRRMQMDDKIKNTGHKQVLQRTFRK